MSTNAPERSSAWCSGTPVVVGDDATQVIREGLLFQSAYLYCSSARRRTAFAGLWMLSAAGRARC